MPSKGQGLFLLTCLRSVRVTVPLLSMHLVLEAASVINLLAAISRGFTLS